MALQSRTLHPGCVAVLAACVAVLIAGCSPTGHKSSAPTGSALKVIDPQALRAIIDTAAKKMKVPGAMVLVRTPQGTFDVAVVTTELGVAVCRVLEAHMNLKCFPEKTMACPPPESLPRLS